MTFAELAQVQAAAASRQLSKYGNCDMTDAAIGAHASLAAAYASLAVAEELARFEAVAVEEREQP